MKTITPVLLLVLFSNAIQAQIKKNQWMIGGRIDFSHANGDAAVNTTVAGDSKNTNYEASASLGYFFIDKFCAGLRLGAGGTYAKQDYSYSNVYSSSDSKATTVNLSPFVRYYFLNVSQKVNFFADAAYTYSHGRTETDGTQVINIPGGMPSITEYHVENKVNSNSYSIAAGPAFFLNTKVSVELFLKYSHSKINKTGQSGNMIGAGVGFQIHLGK
jgi:hypothetical protein